MWPIIWLTPFAKERKKFTDNAMNDSTSTSDNAAMNDESKPEPTMITVEVAYALPHRQKIIALQVPAGTTAMESVVQSGIVDVFPEIDLESAKMGIFGQALGTRGLKEPNGYVMEPLDRVEIYRPLTADPKEVRKRRAEKAKQEKASDDAKMPELPR